MEWINVEARDFRNFGKLMPVREVASSEDGENNFRGAWTSKLEVLKHEGAALVIVAIIFVIAIIAAVIVAHPTNAHADDWRESQYFYNGTSSDCKIWRSEEEGWTHMKLNDTISKDTKLEDGDYIFDDITYPFGEEIDYIAINYNLRLDYIRYHNSKGGKWLDINADDGYCYFPSSNERGISDRYMMAFVYDSRNREATEVRAIIEKDKEGATLNLDFNVNYDTVDIEVIPDWGVHIGNFVIDMCTNGRAAYIGKNANFVQTSDGMAKLSFENKFFKFTNLRNLKNDDYIFDDWYFAGDCITVGKNNQQKIDYIQYENTYDISWLYIDEEKEASCLMRIYSSNDPYKEQYVDLGGDSDYKTLILNNPPDYDRISFG